MLNVTIGEIGSLPFQTKIKQNKVCNENIFLKQKYTPKIYPITLLLGLLPS
jgi:hypothetical protein